MMISYSSENDLTTAFGLTFDGEHPCELCCAIQKEKQERPQRSLLEREQIPIATETWLLWDYDYEPARDVLPKRLRPLNESAVPLCFLAPATPPPIVG